MKMGGVAFAKTEENASHTSGTQNAAELEFSIHSSTFIAKSHAKSLH